MHLCSAKILGTCLAAAGCSAQSADGLINIENSG